jgi:hypothetical protein
MIESYRTEFLSIIILFGNSINDDDIKCVFGEMETRGNYLYRTSYSRLKLELKKSSQEQSTHTWNQSTEFILHVFG